MHVCTYVCMYACMHVCMYVCMHAYIHTYIHACMHTYINTYIHYIHTYIHIYIHTCIHTYLHTCIRRYIHTYYITCFGSSRKYKGLFFIYFYLLIASLQKKHLMESVVWACNEVFLLHGTKASNAHSILKQGFDDRTSCMGAACTSPLTFAKQPGMLTRHMMPVGIASSFPGSCWVILIWLQGP